jgi:hypothetical protein
MKEWGALAYSSHQIKTGLVFEVFHFHSRRQLRKLISLNYTVTNFCFVLVWFLVILGFELRASPLLVRHSTTPSAYIERETESCHVTQADLKFGILLPQPPNYRSPSSCPA